MANLTGKMLLNRYRVDEFIGRGGMAEVYKVWDVQRMTFLAMKVLHQDLATDKIFIRRFQREARTFRKFSIPISCVFMTSSKKAASLSCCSITSKANRSN